ncbi:MAG: NADP-dependent isocitrate dehydrogenase [Tannerella sp.]|jgi:isocitrate dehydrogenase|nr:NADP-dependent isocitrate dehydrogenase [Tannerella sp.]
MTEKYKIRVQDGKLIVPPHVYIPYITGDGVGSEIMPVCKDVVNVAVAKAYGGKRSVIWKEVYAGERSFIKYGNRLPDETLWTLEKCIVGIKGPLTTPVGGGIRSINVTLRQKLDLYVCLRPIRWFRGVSSPLREPHKVNMVVFRENTEDIYAGIEWDKNTPEAIKFAHFLQKELHVTNIRFPDSSAFGVKPVSEEGSKRLVRAAIRYAIENHLPNVTLVHKGNIMKFTEGGFKRWGYEIAQEEFGDKVFTMAEYERIVNMQDDINAAKEALNEAKKNGKVIVKDVIADAFLQNTLLKPEEYSVIATLNLNGDYISDQLAAMVGGIGIAPGANINRITGHAIFEATHGTAPDIVGENRANPSSLLLSAVMMLEYIQWNEAAKLIIDAMEQCYAEGNATPDLSSGMPNGKNLTTTQFHKILIEKIYPDRDLSTT